MARGCRSCRRLAGQRPATSPSGRRLRFRETPSLPSPPLGRGSNRFGHVAPVGALRAFGPMRARCPRSQDIAPGAVARAGEWVARGVAPVGALRAFGPMRARCPRSQDIAPGAVARAGEWMARVCRSCRRLAGLRPDAGKMPALPGTSLPGPWLGRGSGWIRCVAPVGTLRAFGPLRARCPRSQDIASLQGWLGERTAASQLCRWQAKP